MKKRWLALGLFVLAAAGGGFYYNGKLADEKAASSPTPIQAIKKVYEDAGDRVDYIIHEERVEGGEVIFSLREFGNKDFGFYTHADFVRKTRFGWKYGYGGGFSYGMQRKPGEQPTLGEHGLSDLDFGMYVPSTEGTGLGSSPFPMYVGVLTSPQAASVVVTSIEDDLEKQARIIPIDNEYRLYFVFLDASQGKKFRLTTYDADGKKLKEREVDEGAQAGVSQGVSASASASASTTP